MTREELIPAPLDVLYIIAHSLLGRYPSGISGIHPFLALLHAVTSKKPTDPELHDGEFGMLCRVGHKDAKRCKPVHAEVFQNISGTSERIRALYRGFHRDHCSLRTEKKEDEEEARSMEKRWYEFTISQQVALVASFTENLVNYRAAEIGKQNLALVPRETQIGREDYVCIVHGYNLPASLKRVENHFIHEGACFVTGLIDSGVVK